MNGHSMDMDQRQAVMKSRRRGLLLLLLPPLLLLPWLFEYALSTGTRTGEVLARATSARGEYEAELIEINGGATDAFAYEVVLRAPRRLFAMRKVAFKSYMEPVPTAIRFTRDNTLEITLEEGAPLTVTFDEQSLELDRPLRFHRGVLQIQ